MEKYSKKIGFIPDDWDFIDAKNCLILESGMRPKEYVTDIETDVPSLGGENIDEKGFLVFDNVRYINPNYYRKMTKGHIQDDDIYINKDGANTGKVAYCRKKPFQECAVNEHVFLIRNDGSFIQQFLFYCLLSDKGHKQILKKIIGSAQEGINNSFTKGIILPQPPLAEQTAIAKILSTVDEAIRSTRETISKLERVKKSLMQNLLSGKMKPDGTLRPATEFYEDEKMGLVPKGWKSVKLKEVGFIQTGKTPPTAESNVFANSLSEGYMFITPGDLGENKYIIDSERYVTDKGLRFSYRLPIESIVVVCIGSTIGKIGIISTESCTNQQINAIIVNDMNNNEFLYYLMQYKMPHFKEIAGVNATPQINKSTFQKYRIIIPIDKQEQCAIANKLDTIDSEINNKQEKITALELLKKSLMQQLLTGRVRVK